MRKKIRLLTTLFSLLIVGFLLVISTTIGLSAASNVNVFGSGNLSYEVAMTPSEQDDVLKSMGFHTTGSGDNRITLADMKNPSTNEEFTIQELKYNSINSGILKYELYKKVNCQRKTDETNYVYELQVVLDFSKINIYRYAGECLLYFNQIAFCENLSNVKLYDFYTGDELANDLTINFKKVGNDYEYEIISKSEVENFTHRLAYKIVLNDYYDNSGNLTNVVIGNNTFCFIAEKGEFNGGSIDTVYLDFSNKNITYDPENKSLLGIEFSQDIGGTKLTDNNHIHIIGKTNNQYEAGLFLAKEYTLGHEDYEISIYRKLADYKYEILCKVQYNGSINNVEINVVSNGEQDSQVDKQSLIDMCYWVEVNIDDSKPKVYYQLVDSDKLFAARYEVHWELESENWYTVYYSFDSNKITLGRFNSQNYQTVI